MAGAKLKLSSATVKGFRSLGDVTIQLTNYNCLIGKNDAGKSSFLRALQLLFDPLEAPSPEDRCTIQREGNEYSVEATLTSAAEHQLARDGQIRVRRNLGEARAFEVWGDTPTSAVLGKLMIGSTTKAEIAAADIPTSTKARINELLPAGRANAEEQIAAFQTLEAEALVTFRQGWRPLPPEEITKLVQPILLKADSRAEEEMADKGQSTFRKLGGLLLQQATQGDVELLQARKVLEERITELGSRAEGRWALDDLNRMEAVLKEEIGRFDSDVDVQSHLMTPTVPNFGFGITLDVHDACTTLTRNMGHGLRRTIVFAMICTLSRMSEIRALEEGQSTPLYLFLIEEPEIYLHPQAERKRNADLHRLAGLPNSQVVLCTHSAFFVELADYRGISRMQRERRGLTQVFRWHGVDLDEESRDTLLAARSFHPTRAAMLFADQVILTEGETESVTVPPIAERNNLPVDGVEFVQVAGNGNMPIYQRVLTEFGIRHVVWLDSDKRDKVQEAKASLDPILGRLVLTDHNWERMNGLAAAGDKIFQSWKKYVRDKENPNARTLARIAAAYNFQSYEADPKEEAA